jgi:hypothetical protein
MLIDLTAAMARLDQEKRVNALGKGWKIGGQMIPEACGQWV